MSMHREYIIPCKFKKRAVNHKAIRSKHCFCVNHPMCCIECHENSCINVLYKKKAQKFNETGKNRLLGFQMDLSKHETELGNFEMEKDRVYIPVTDLFRFPGFDIDTFIRDSRAQHMDCCYLKAGKSRKYFSIRLMAKVALSDIYIFLSQYLLLK